MSQVQEKYKPAEEIFGSELLNLVIAKGYLKKLMENVAVRSYVARHASEILSNIEYGQHGVSRGASQTRGWTEQDYKGS